MDRAISVEQDILIKYQSLCDVLTQTLNVMERDLLEVCSKTRFKPIVNIVNETISSFNGEVLTVAMQAFDEWEGCEGNLSIREYFFDFWYGHPLGETISIDCSRPNLKSDDINEMDKIGQIFKQKVMSIDEYTINIFSRTAEYSELYTMVIPAIKAITDSVEWWFEIYLAQVQKFIEEYKQCFEKTRCVDIKESNVKAFYPSFIQYLEKCSDEIVLIPADSTRINLVDLRLYNAVIKQFRIESDIDVATEKSVQMLDRQIEGLQWNETEIEEKREQLMNRLAIVRNKIFKHSILFFVDKYKGRTPKTSSLSAQLEDIYTSVV
jgi:hypothetical protein